MLQTKQIDSSLSNTQSINLGMCDAEDSTRNIKLKKLRKGLEKLYGVSIIQKIKEAPDAVSKN